MKNNIKKIILAVSICVMAMFCCSCNKQFVDLSYNFNYAQVAMPDGSFIEGRVESWRDYDGDQIQVNINGVIYLTNSSRIVLMCK